MDPIKVLESVEPPTNRYNQKKKGFQIFILQRETYFYKSLVSTKYQEGTCVQYLDKLIWRVKRTHVMSETTFGYSFAGGGEEWMWINWCLNRERTLKKKGESLSVWILHFGHVSCREMLELKRGFKCIKFIIKKKKHYAM